MKRLGPISVPIVLVGAAVFLHAQAPPAPAPVTGLTVPAGFEVERVAGPPLVNRPIVADFDEEGRLYVADSSGSNDRVETQLAERPHRIVRLEDSDGDGTFDKSVVFADRMMLPEGTMWFDGSLYVAAPPSIWRLTDTDGDGVADQREEWFRGETLTGCANDLHGPYLGPDGWIYWTKGAFAEQTYLRSGKRSLVTRAAHIFRRRPGDPAIDVVMAGGMDNPVDVAFTSSGERILTATFVEHPQAGRRDGLIHAIYGGVYGKPHAVIDGHKRTGDLMPVMCQLGPAVPAGLTRYASRVFGNDYRDSFFAALFNLRKVSRHVLVPDGATFTTRDSDFLVSNDRDFHPTDVIEDADGSLLVVDTGPWYKLCCPTSQLAKPDILGAIYRVRRTAAPRVADPRGRTLSWSTMSPAELTGLLADPRPAVQARAIAQLATAGGAAIPTLATSLRQSPSADVRRGIVWTLTRVEGPQARGAVRVALSDRDASVRQAAAHSAGLWRDADALPDLRRMVRSGAAPIQRAAAEAIGRIGDGSAVPDLLAAAASQADRVLEHSLTYALIEIGDRTAVVNAGLAASSPSSRRAALIALDQMDDGQLTSAGLVSLLDSRDARLRETAWWIAARHPEWGGAFAEYFQRALSAPLGAAADRDALQQKLTQFAIDPAIQQLLADTVERAGSANARLVALAAMAAAGSSSLPVSSRVRELPPAWTRALAAAVTTANDEMSHQVVRVARAIPAGPNAGAGLSDALMRVARNRSRSPEIRVDALSALPGSIALDADLFDLLRTSLAPASPAALRGPAAAIVERATLDRAHLLALLPLVETAGPLELPRLLPAFDKGRDAALGMALVAALERAASRSSVRADILRPRLEQYPDQVKQAGEALLATSRVDTAAQARRLEDLLSAAPGGDIARGQAIFNGARASCISCHTIGYIGGKIGPDLTRVGRVRSDRDLLESVVFPNVSFARGYEPINVRRRSGAAVGGVLRSDAPDEVIVSDAAGIDTRIPRRDVADMQAGQISLMPSGYGDLLTRQELADLLAFLRAAR
jgi:putative membrane-bound dehydrogenase-like protein